MTAPSDLTRRVCVVTGALAVPLAAVCGVLGGAQDALGVLVGSALTLLHFGGLGWTVARVTGTGGPSLRRRMLWVGASGLRLGLFAVAAGVGVGAGGLGLAGLLLSLTLVPVAVVLAGLAAARAA